MMSVLALSLPREVLGLGAITGLAYGLVAIGLILTYRASRTINFAHGQVGALAAVVLGVLVQRWSVPYWSAFVVALATGAALSALIELTVVRRLRDVAPLMTLIGTLGVAQVLLYLTVAVGASLTTGALFPQPAGLPRTHLGTLTLTPASWGMLILAPAAVAGLVVLLGRTTFGAAVRASAANPDAARVLGIRARRMSTVSWALAGALSALTAALVLPAGVIPTASALGPSLLLRALAAAALARMNSLPVAFGAGIAIGVVDETVEWNAHSGFADVILFGAILLALLLRPPATTRLVEREDWTSITRLTPLSRAARAVPLVRWGGPLAGALALGGAVTMAAILRPGDELTLTTVACFALVGLSVWVVTGLTGELSLGQFALAGVGAAFVVVIGNATGSSLIGLLCAPIGAAVVAVAIALPALRLRGPLLAVSTLGFAIAAQSWFLGRTWALGPEGAAVKPLALGPLRFDTPARSYLLTLGALALALALVSNLARTGTGRRLRAVRDNDQAARAFGIPASFVRLQAFALGGALAGLGGALLALSLSRVSPGSFPADASLQVVALTVLGGLAFSGGSTIGALYIVALPAFVSLSSATLAATAFGWLALIVIVPGGLAAAVEPVRRRTVAALLRVSGHDPAILLAARPAVGGHPAMPEAPTLAPQPEGTVADRTEPPALELDGVARHFGGVRAIDGVTLRASAGEVVGLIGPNGAGKTTLFDLACGVVAPTRGRVRLNGEDVTYLPTAARAARGLVRTFQDADLFPTFTVSEVIALALERRHPSSLTSSVIGGGRGERTKRARANELVGLLGLEPWADAPVHTLSTGTRRVTELACMLALEPRVLLLDEPSAGLAQRETEALVPLLRNVHERLGVPMILIEHDLALVMGLAHRIVVLAEGCIVAEGTPAAISADPQARAALGMSAADALAPEPA